MNEGPGCSVAEPFPRVVVGAKPPCLARGRPSYLSSVCGRFGVLLFLTGTPPTPPPSFLNWVLGVVVWLAGGRSLEVLRRGRVRRRRGGLLGGRGGRPWWKIETDRLGRRADQAVGAVLQGLDHFRDGLWPGWRDPSARPGRLVFGSAETRDAPAGLPTGRPRREGRALGGDRAAADGGGVRVRVRVEVGWRSSRVWARCGRCDRSGPGPCSVPVGVGGRGVLAAAHTVP